MNFSRLRNHQQGDQQRIFLVFKRYINAAVPKIFCPDEGDAHWWILGRGIFYHSAAKDHPHGIQRMRSSFFLNKNKHMQPVCKTIRGLIRKFRYFNTGEKRNWQRNVFEFKRNNARC